MKKEVAVLLFLPLLFLGCATKGDVKLLKNNQKELLSLCQENLSKTSDIEKRLDQLEKRVSSIENRMAEHMNKGKALRKRIAHLLEQVNRKLHAKIKVYATVAGCEYLTIRKGPSLDSEPVGFLKKGDKVEILAIEGNWARCRRGYISTAYLIFEFKTE